MKVCLITPAGKSSRSGNRTTAVRWAGILRQLGHRVQVTQEYANEPADMLVAIHAWRSRVAIARFRERWPERPLVVLLAGTDIYRFQHSHPSETLPSLEMADQLIGLHDRVHHDIPARFASKLKTIYQSYVASRQPREPLKRFFQVCVVGHLRDEKDPFCAARAARLLPADSKLRVVHLGKAIDASWESAAHRETETNPRYLWRGERTVHDVRRCYARSHAMVMSSVMEGGANVVSEAIVTGLPVLASDISGNRGLLGDDHPAYFPPTDHRALADLLLRAETDPSLLAQCISIAEPRRNRFTPAAELRAWRSVIGKLT